jgi:hypothetical protein
MQALPAALAPMGAYKQFLNYKLVPSVKQPGKMDKFPVNPSTGEVCNAHDRNAWASFDGAAQAGLLRGHGVAFVFADTDPFWFLDIDGAYDGNDWNATAKTLCAEFAGCAIEVSQSGRGLHIFGSGAVPEHGTRNRALHLEFYHRLRFVALTGTHATGNAAHTPHNLTPLVNRYFPPGSDQSTDVGADWWSMEPVPEWNGPQDDATLLQRALRSKSAASVFGGDRASFADLWDGDEAILAKAFPDDKHPYNASSADQALAQHLAFWTGKNAERIKTLMLESGLVRDKWDRRGDDYLARTIRKACAWQKDVLIDPPPSASPFEQALSDVPFSTEALRISEKTLLQPDEQVQFFKGCVYVADEHKIMVPNGALVDSSRFNALYGGRSFVMDGGNTRVVKKAFEAFTESQVYRFPRADSTCFRPLETPGEIIREAGFTRVNVYRPCEVKRAKGDPGRFLHHLAKLIPDERDRQILLGYMACVVQYQGHKLQWAPLLQSTTGTGKGLIGIAIKKAIGRPLCYSPRAEEIGNNFNFWLTGHTFYCVDEIYIPDKRTDLLEVLKPMITGDEEGQEVTKKGVDSEMRDTCGNFWFNTNHQNALKKDKHDRRIAEFFMAQQDPDDLMRDGLDAEYILDLVEWLKGSGRYAGHASGYSIVAEYLWTVPIAREFDPRKDVRAPKTSSTQRALEVGKGRVEQEVAELIAMGNSGFRGGWVSSAAFRNLLREMKISIPLTRHQEILKSLGYIPHPALPDGRVNNPVLPDGTRVRLYVDVRQADLLTINEPSRVAEAYSAAQAFLPGSV